MTVTELLQIEGDSYFWVFASGCCQKPPVCSTPPTYIGLHMPPKWSVEYISSKEGVMYYGVWIPLDEFIGEIGTKIPEPNYTPNSDGWDHGAHYTMGGGSP